MAEHGSGRGNAKWWVLAGLAVASGVGLSAALRSDPVEPALASDLLAAAHRQTLEASASQRPVAPVTHVIDPASLPPLPEGVAHLHHRDLYRLPVGPRGLEYSEVAHELEGSRVRMAGYVVRSVGTAQLGYFILSPIPVTLHDAEMGPCDDLPATIVYCRFPTGVMPFAPEGAIEVTGTLELGPRAERDGRVSSVRLILDAPRRGGDRNTTNEQAGGAGGAAMGGAGG